MDVSAGGLPSCSQYTRSPRCVLSSSTWSGRPTRASVDPGVSLAAGGGAQGGWVSAGAVGSVCVRWGSAQRVRA
jgi:hypothetical protein